METKIESNYPQGTPREILIEEILPILSDFQRRQLLESIQSEGSAIHVFDSAFGIKAGCVHCGEDLELYDLLAKKGVGRRDQGKQMFLDATRLDVTCTSCQTVNVVLVMTREMDISVRITSASEMARIMLG